MNSSMEICGVAGGAGVTGSDAAIIGVETGCGFADVSLTGEAPFIIFVLSSPCMRSAPLGDSIRGNREEPLWVTVSGCRPPHTIWAFSKGVVNSVEMPSWSQINCALLGITGYVAKLRQRSVSAMVYRTVLSWSAPLSFLANVQGAVLSTY